MGTKTFNNYEDLLTFTRASGGHALRPVSYGSELVTNTWVDNSAGSSSISESNGELTLTCVGSDVAWAYEQIDLKAGSLYVVSYEVKQDVGGNVHIYIGETTAGSQSYSKLASVGSYTDSFIASANTSYISLREFTAGTAIVDNISVKEVTFDQPDGTLTLFEHPNNIPRVEWDAQRNRLGLLVEESRTNDILYSEDFDTVWQKPFSGTGTEPVVTTDYAPAPYSANGRASRLQANKTSGSGYSLLQVAPSGSYTGDSTASIWVKSNTGASQTVYFRAGNIGAQEKTVTTEWTRIENSQTLSSGQRYLSIGNRDGIGSENIDILIWGAQLEQASFPTSYIKTTGATATRSADVASMELTEFGYNHDEGTVLIDFNMTYDSGGSKFPRAFEITAGTSATDRILCNVSESSNNLVVNSFVNNVTQAPLTLKTSLSGTAEGKVAFAFKKDDFAASDDGDTVVTDTSGTFEPSSKRTKLTFGGTGTGTSAQINGHIKSFKYYPRRLTNAQLQEISS